MWDPSCDRFHDNYRPIINLGQDFLASVTTLFKLAAPSLSSCALSIYFNQFYLCYCLVRIRCRYWQCTIYHCANVGVFKRLFTCLKYTIRRLVGVFVWVDDLTQIIAHAHWSQSIAKQRRSVDPSIKDRTIIGPYRCLHSWSDESSVPAVSSSQNALACSMPLFLSVMAAA